jgi:hypothetical protein
VALEDVSVAAGQPWWAVLSLTNRGSFPITLGPGGMVNPVFVLSFASEGDRQRSYPALMTVSVERARILRPGESVEVRRTLDIGPLRWIAWQTPQQAQRVALRAVLDAYRNEEGEWVPAPGGQRLRSVYFNRLPVVTSPAALNGLLAAVREGAPSERYRAIEMMAQLIGEQQRARWKRLEYRPTRLPTEKLTRALLAVLERGEWEVRARGLATLWLMGLDRAMLEAVAGNLDHPHWLVRLLALRVLARQGASFAERAAALAESDPDELVRRLARSYVDKWRMPAASSQPANR